MPMPVWIPFIVIGAWVYRAAHVAAMMRGLWHAYRVGAWTFQVVKTSPRMIQIAHRTGDYTVKLMKDGKVSVARMGSKSPDVPSYLQSELRTFVTRGNGFRGLYEKGGGATGRWLEVAIKHQAPW